MIEFPTRSSLIITYAESKQPLDFLLFYGGHNKKGMGPHVFSQWYISPFRDEFGTIFASAEHYMMYQKAKLFEDETSAQKILDAATPRDSKFLGREVKNFDKRMWYRWCRSFVLKGSWLKFTSDEELAKYILNTGNDVLVECSPTDTIWGIGKPIEHEDCLDPVRWNGLNWLGFSLMYARTCIRQKRAPVPDLAWLANKRYGKLGRQYPF